jgi:hypothetical protein
MLKNVYNIDHDLTVDKARIWEKTTASTCENVKLFQGKKIREKKIMYCERKNLSVKKMLENITTYISVTSHLHN